MGNLQQGSSLKSPKAIRRLLLLIPRPRLFPKLLALNPLWSLPILLEVEEVLVLHHPPIPLPMYLELVNLGKQPNPCSTRIIRKLYHRSQLTTMSPTLLEVLLLPLPLPVALLGYRHPPWLKPTPEVRQRLAVLLDHLPVLPVLLLALLLRLPIWRLQLLLLLARWVDYGGNLTYPLRLDPILPRESIQED